MVQGIDYPSVSPIFSVLLQFGFVSVVYRFLNSLSQFAAVNVVVLILLVNVVESRLSYKTIYTYVV